MRLRMVKSGCDACGGDGEAPRPRATAPKMRTDTRAPFGPCQETLIKPVSLIRFTSPFEIVRQTSVCRGFPDALHRWDDDKLKFVGPRAPYSHGSWHVVAPGRFLHETVNDSAFGGAWVLFHQTYRFVKETCCISDEGFVE
jgi:hypothetical protein